MSDDNAYFKGCGKSLEKSLLELISLDQASLARWIDSAVFEDKYSPLEGLMLRLRDPAELLRNIYEITEERFPEFRSRFESSLADVISRFHNSKDYATDRLFRFSTNLLFFIGTAGTFPDRPVHMPWQPLVKACYEALIDMALSGEYVKQENYYPPKFSRAYENTFLQSEIINVIREYAIEKKDIRIKDICLDGVKNPVSAMHFIYSYATLAEFDNSYLSEYFDKFVDIRLTHGKKYLGPKSPENVIISFFLDEFEVLYRRYPSIMPVLLKDYSSRQAQGDIRASLYEAYNENLSIDA